MKLWNHYFTPTQLDEASRLLAQYAGNARVIAGGTDLLVDARAEENHAPFEALVDITGIPEMQGIYQEGDQVYVGAGVPHTHIVKSKLLRQEAICLVEGCGVIGGPQVRNVATLGGNVAHALPAGDGTTALVVLDAETEVIYDGERKWVPIAEMFRGPAQSLLDSSRDLLIRFRFPKRGGGEGTAFERIMRPQGVALPVLSCAVWVKLNDRGDQFVQIRACVAPAGPVPARLEAAEAVAVGQPADPETFEKIIEAALSTLKLRTSKYRATAEYREELAAVLLRRTLTNAVERARE
ncbi:MAG: FAD binding domain-containing protein [Anaerolineae bacterium]|nr:FAD binding domain-containing protein [Anaerolineae bacterium]